MMYLLIFWEVLADDFYQPEPAGVYSTLAQCEEVAQILMERKRYVGKTVFSKARTSDVTLEKERIPHECRQLVEK